MVRLISLLILSIAFCSCQQEPLAPDQFAQWVENPENGLKVTQAVGGVEFELHYRPHDYIALLESKHREKFGSEELEKRREELSGLQYYSLKLRRTSGEDLMTGALNSEQEFYGRVDYFSSAMENDLRLVDGSDTLSCSLFHLERTYGISPYKTVLLAFPESDGASSDKHLIYNDQVLGTGPVHMTIPREKIEAIPELNTALL